MSYLTIVILIFSVLGAIDKMLGNRLGLGKEFERPCEVFSVNLPFCGKKVCF